jgi:type IV pilus assembly protein PilB|tara:strand:+ start:3570 stop:5153 length:1584 start_codon:yes stop_codon:yes gene_type:complete
MANQDLKVPSIDLTGRKILVEVLKEIPEEAATFYKFVPISRQGKILEVGMINPDDLKAKEALRFITRRNYLELKIFAISQEHFRDVLKQYRSLRGEVKKALKQLETEIKIEEKVKLVEGKVEGITDKIVSDAPITKIVAVILKHAIEGGASDIHIEPAENEVRVRFRVDGVLYTSLVLPKETQAAIVSRIKILSKLKIDETRVPQDGRFHTVVGNNKIDFRISTLPTPGGEKVALRILDPTVGLKSFAGLGLQGYNLDILEKGIQNPFGMILLTGPTGSGKTTTLYAILNKLNQEKVNIISLEDPIEYFIKGLNQSQIKPGIDYTFASGLRHILRQDPDIIMVGEIRDEETAGLVIHAALTGHILLSTLHTNNAIGVIPRLIDMGVGPFLLPTSLNLAIAQRLIRRLCQKCKKEVAASTKAAEMIEQEISSLDSDQRKGFTWQKPYKIYRAKGCKFCGNKGTKGRMALFEILIMTPQLEAIINQGLSESKIKEEAQRQGMITIKQDGIFKVLQGSISFEEMVKVIEE